MKSVPYTLAPLALVALAGVLLSLIVVGSRQTTHNRYGWHHQQQKGCLSSTTAAHTAS
jgi:hypothetical protein